MMDGFRHEPVLPRRVLAAAALAVMGLGLAGCEPKGDVLAPGEAGPRVVYQTQRDAEAAAEQRDGERDAEGEAAEEPDIDNPLEPGELSDRWSDLLAAAVSPRSGALDYVQLRDEAETLAELVAGLQGRRSFSDDDERLAFLLNAYNMLVVATVVEQVELPATVRDIPGFFDERRHRVLGNRYTLDELRDTVIRPLGEPRAHFALANGAVGGPLMLDRAYSPDVLDRQLDHQTARFLADPTRNSALGPTLMLSPLFRWFRDDFEAATEDGTLTGFVREHAPAASAVGRLLRQDDEPEVAFFEFNWALNHRRRPAGAAAE